MEDRHIVGLWKLTRPRSKEHADKFLRDLRALYRIPQDDWFEPYFLRPKSTPGIYRRIVPATSPLVRVQLCIAQWLRNMVPSEFDYGNPGYGVLRAVKKHQGALSGHSLDLRSAYDYVTDTKLRKEFKRRMPQLGPVLVEALIGILTFEGSTPQGCVSTGPAFNFLFERTDRKIRQICSGLPVYAVTRYVDNILVSFTVTGNSVHVAQLDSDLRAAIADGGFEVGRTAFYRELPLEYLGVKVFTDRLEFTDAKLRETVVKVRKARRSTDPKSRKKSVGGMLGWTGQVYGDNMPQELLNAFTDYYDVAGPYPKSLTRMLNLKLRQLGR